MSDLKECPRCGETRLAAGKQCATCQMEYSEMLRHAGLPPSDNRGAPCSGEGETEATAETRLEALERQLARENRVNKRLWIGLALCLGFLGAWAVAATLGWRTATTEARHNRDMLVQLTQAIATAPTPPPVVTPTETPAATPIPVKIIRQKRSGFWGSSNINENR